MYQLVRAERTRFQPFGHSWWTAKAWKAGATMLCWTSRSLKAAGGQGKLHPWVMDICWCIQHFRIWKSSLFFFHRYSTSKMSLGREITCQDVQCLHHVSNNYELIWPLKTCMCPTLLVKYILKAKGMADRLANVQKKAHLACRPGNHTVSMHTYLYLTSSRLSYMIHTHTVVISAINLLLTRSTRLCSKITAKIIYNAFVHE